MTSLRPLRGGCQCGRNRYIIGIPHDSRSEAQVLFNTDSVHQIPLGTPLAAYIRVPLSWYQSTTHAFFPDETHTLIRRSYTHSSQQHSKRCFCGYCGTPLSYWSEHPPSEAEYINLTLGSLLREDLRDLEDMGLIPEDENDNGKAEQNSPISGDAADRSAALRQSFGVPWFDGMVEGTKLGRLRRSHGVQQSQDGRVQVEWEVVEYSGDGSQSAEAEGANIEPIHAKRKLQDREDAEVDM
ncbi:hypothetical protein B0J13DRAFT_615109 [Dactylonectria estremocensis]|uniref:CENP-V/GFA domain-containing protein n=1 Tax=Dactylonectria estremocensis TaxID=1079267 RepID=A0A9P9FHW2_9HYPO|nr:hypothetical protein B0J13DRAFT_615109 [Dactylonectria estremocensis]